jgi:hypothetical protein
LEDDLELTNWILKNASILSLKADKYIWVNEWIKGFFDYGITIVINGIKYVGRGIDRNEATAFEKASAEALERASVDFEGLTDNRWATAAYPTFYGACERAYWELLGIDRVFCHHFCRKKMQFTPLSILAKPFNINKLKKIISKDNISINLYELRPALDAKVYCAIAYDDKRKRIKGFISGFGVDKSREEAALHALIECARTAVVCLFTDYKPEEPIEELRKRGEPRWHFWQAQTEESLKYLSENLITNENEIIDLKPENISIKDINFTELKLLKRKFSDLPLFFVQANSDKLISPQFGEFMEDNKTIKRLEEFNNGSVIINKIIPHFYG